MIKLYKGRAVINLGFMGLELIIDVRSGVLNLYIKMTNKIQKQLDS